MKSPATTYPLTYSNNHIQSRPLDAIIYFYVLFFIPADRGLRRRQEIRRAKQSLPLLSDTPRREGCLKEALNYQRMNVYLPKTLYYLILHSFSTLNWHYYGWMGGVIQWDLKMQFFTPSRSNICRVAQTDPFVILFIIWCWGRGLLLVFHPFFLFSPLHVFFSYFSSYSELARGFPLCQLHRLHQHL